MNATELQKENERLKKLLSQQAAELSQSRIALSQSHAELSGQATALEQARQQHTAVVTEFSQALETKQRSIAQLEHQIKLLLQKIRGSRQERIDPDQLTLFSMEELEQIAQQLKQGDPEDDLLDNDLSKGKRRRRRGRSGKLPDHLPREIIRHELSEAERSCPCCGQTRDEIGVETSEQLELIPAQLKAIQHDRVKYACRDCQQHDVSAHVAIADKPPQPIEKGLPGPGLCAYTVLSKFGDHTPLYRTEDITSRFGYTIRRSTQCGWQAELADLALPLVMRMKYLILQSKVIHTDDTSIKLLEGGPAQTAKFWPYLGDCDHPYVVFEFTRTRERDGPARFLEGFAGFLQADAYSGYDGIYAGDKVKEVACWIHARRYWHQAQDNDPVRATQALSFIARLSQIETQLREAYPYENLQGQRNLERWPQRDRNTRCRFWRASKRGWIRRKTTNEFYRRARSAAFTYTLNQWKALCRYTEEGDLSFDNNLAERTVKDSAPHWCGKDRLFDRENSGKSRYFCTFAGYAMAT